MKGKKTGGRQKGTLNKRTLELQAQAEGQVVVRNQYGTKIGPVDVMLETMRALWAKAEEYDANDPEGGNIKLDYMRQACVVAAQVAPYTSPKLAPVQVAAEQEMLDVTPKNDLEIARTIAHALTLTAHRQKLLGARH
jgi:hypothetical protein